MRKMYGDQLVLLRRVTMRSQGRQHKSRALQLDFKKLEKIDKLAK